MSIAYSKTDQSITLCVLYLFMKMSLESS